MIDVHLWDHVLSAVRKGVDKALSGAGSTRSVQELLSTLQHAGSTLVFSGTVSQLVLWKPSLLCLDLCGSHLFYACTPSVRGLVLPSCFLAS
jgi:hypothetical protein